MVKKNEILNIINKLGDMYTLLLTKFLLKDLVLKKF